MLFRTVYGSELEAVYHFIAQADSPLSRQTIHMTFIPQHPEGKTVSTQNVDDALTFLESTRLIEIDDGYRAINFENNEPFRVSVLRQLRQLELGLIEPIHSIDPLYMLILQELFILPNQIFIADVHSEANKLQAIANVGGLSHEKLQTWKRVMEFLGVGQRVAGGFRCVYSPQLLVEIIDQWPEADNTLQLFFEELFDKILPYQTMDGNLAQAVEAPLRYLNRLGYITLSPRQDSPNKPYFGEQKFRYITRREIAHAVI